MRREDLLDHEIERAGGLLAQPEAIGLGVEQAVDMVDAQPVEHAATEETEHESMRAVEDLGDLHADAGKVVDVEEAAVVDVVGGDAEVRRPPELAADQRVEPAPRGEVPRRAVEGGNRAIDRARDLGIAFHQRRKLRLQLSGAAPDVQAKRREMRKRVAHPLQRRMVRAEDRGIAQRADRQLVGVVGPDRESAFLGVEAQLRASRPPARRRTGRRGTGPAACCADSGAPNPSRCRTSRHIANPGPIRARRAIADCRRRRRPCGSARSQESGLTRWRGRFPPCVRNRPSCRAPGSAHCG